MDRRDPGTKPRIAVFAGATATILNTPPLITSNQARRRHGLPPRVDAWGVDAPDALRPQRLAAPVTVWVEAFTAHPLERDAADLYAPPDGWMDAGGQVHDTPTDPADRPVHRVELRPEDGLFALPYMARQADGSAWDGDGVRPGADARSSRQPFFPDASRLFEEIDRFAIEEDGATRLLGSRADFDFYRVIPPGGYPTGRTADERTDVGEGDIAPERIWEDFFPYRPFHLRREPPRWMLAQVTNRVQSALREGAYAGALWLEGSPFIEESIYWLNLTIDTQLPIVACASPDFPHGALGGGGDRHLVDGVRYITSRIWADADGRDRVGAVLMSAEQVFAARDVQKADARPGGYIATGGHGGIVASMGEPGEPVLTFVPARRHTAGSSVRLVDMPAEVRAVRRVDGRLVEERLAVKDVDGSLRGAAIPSVALYKHARYMVEDNAATPEGEVELLARMDRSLERGLLAGFVVEGGAPYGSVGPAADAALRRATCSGMPVVRVSRGNAEGFVPTDRVKFGIAGHNLTATKARILLMACLLRFGALPPAADPASPTTAEIEAIESALRDYQRVFDTH